MKAPTWRGIMVTMFLGAAVAVVSAQSTRLGPQLALNLDSNGYLNVTATGSGSASPSTTGLWSNLFFKTDSNAYLKVNCVSGCGGGVGGSANDVQCNVASALGACETGVLTYDPATHTFSTASTGPVKMLYDNGTNCTIQVGGSANNCFGHESGQNGMFFKVGGAMAMYLKDASDAHFANVWGAWLGDGGSASITNGVTVQKPRSAGGGNSNRAGTNFWIAAGEATGNGAPGDIVFAPGTTGGSGTTERAIAEGGRFDATNSRFNLATGWKFAIAGSAGLTGTSCTAFTGGICTAGSIPAAANNVLRSDLDTLTKEVADLKAVVAEQQRQIAALLSVAKH